MSLLESRKIRTGLFVALSLSVAAVLLLLFLTIDRETWEAVSRIKPVFLLAALALMLVRWGSHILRTMLLIRASGARLGFWKTTKAIMSGIFTGSVTPFRAAGIPVEIYFLYKYGIPAPRATAIIATGSTMSILLFVIAMPAIFVVTASKVDVHLGIRSLLVVAGMVAFFLLVVVLYSMRDPSRAASVVNRRAPGFLKRRTWFDRMVEKFFDAVSRFQKSLRAILGYGKGVLLLAALLTVVLWTSIIFIPPLMLWSLGYPELFWRAALAQLVISYLLPFMPVPGESGMAEATFAGVYAVFVPVNLIGVMALAWRFFTFYLALLVSGIIFVIAARDASSTAAEGPAGPAEVDAELRGSGDEIS